MRTSALFGASVVLGGFGLTGARRCDDPGTFLDPGASRRAMFRYWFPDPSVDRATVAADITSAGAVGAGGVEFVPFYEYAGHIGPPPPGVDWSAYGFGTEPFKDHFLTALRAHADSGMLMDFALGPGMGHGVPTTPDDEGIQWDLLPFSEAVPDDGWQEKRVPGWGQGRLVGLVAASVLAVTNESTPLPSNSFLPAPYENYTQYLLDSTTLRDITDLVSRDGLVSLQGEEFANKTQVFAFYEKKTLARALIFENNVSQTIFDDGAYVVDHYSAKGAETVITFWEDYILKDDEITDLLRRVGRYGWEDSVEIESHVSWSPGLLAAFESEHGYSLRPYLPLLMWQNNNIGLQREDPGRMRAVLNTQDAGEGYINDYRATLQLGYRDYISTLSHWLHERLGLGLRAQVSYNLPMEMGANIPFVDVPECESLGFKDSVDAYRQFTGPAALAGRRVVPNEMGAVFLAAYRHDIPRLLHQCDLAFAGGNNRVVLHGQAFGGNYGGTTWPGHSAFNYFVSEMHSPKHPSWAAGMPEAMEYLARTQFVLQEGVGRADVAVYHHASATDPLMPTLYLPRDLEDAGYSYLYVTPDNLRYETARVENGSLGPDTAGFRAMVLMPGAALTSQAVEELLGFARDGLTIIVSGDPVVQPSADGASKATVLEDIETLKSHENVHLAANGTAAVALASARVRPFVATNPSNGTWITSRRHDKQKGIEYVFLLGSEQESHGDISVQSSGIPYFMNAWTGAISPVLYYNRSADGTSLTIPLTLAADESVLLAFSQRPLRDVAVPDVHISGMSAGLHSSYTEQDGLVLRVPSGDSVRVELSTGEILATGQNETTGSFTLESWKLTAEHWEAPSDLYDIESVAVKHNTTHDLTSPLQSWTDLAPALHNASGLGFYEASFQWDRRQADGAYLALPPVLHAVRVEVNGRPARAVDPRNPVIDITNLLRDGRNDVLLVVPTLMWNHVRVLMPELEMAGTKAFTAKQFTSQIPLPGPVANGIVGRVSVRPFRAVRLGA